VFASTAALLFTACGGGGDKSSDDIKGAGAESSPPASASASTPSGVKRPGGDLPDGTFETAQDMNVQDIQSINR
jgi:hypothetical protein